MGKESRKQKDMFEKLVSTLIRQGKIFGVRKSLTQDSNEKSDAWEALKTCCELTVDHCKSEHC